MDTLESRSALFPPEIWAQVLYWATFSPSRELDSLLSIPRFDSINFQDHWRVCEEALVTKRNVSLVCSEWNSLSKRFLYEDLHVRYNSRLLADLLETTSRQHVLGYGTYVRRISIIEQPMTGTNTRWAGRDLRRIIRCCPNLIVLSRYHNSNKVFDDHLGKTSPEIETKDKSCDDDLEDIDLSSVRRIDWDNGTPNALQRTIAASPRSIWFSSTLEVLSIAGDNYYWPPAELIQVSSLTLPKVHTLRVGSLYTFGVPGVHTYNLILPSLTRVILDRAEAVYRLISCCLHASHEHGAKVRHVEIGSAHKRFTRGDYITQLLEACPEVETLYYPIFCTRALNWRLRPLGPREPRSQTLRQLGAVSEGRNVATRFTSSRIACRQIRRIGWHGERDHESLSLDLNQDKFSESSMNNSEPGAERWAHLVNQFRFILDSFNIRELELCGRPELWIPVVEDSRFNELLSLAQSRDVIFCSEDREVASKLEQISLEQV